MARVLWGEEYATLLLVQNDGKTLEPVPRVSIPEDARMYVGAVGRMNNKLYWLYRAEDRRLLLMGEEMDPIEITDDVKASFADEGGKHRVRLFNDKRVLFELAYDPPEDDWSALVAFAEPDDHDFGLFMFNFLQKHDARRMAWTPEWQTAEDRHSNP